ncbi:unnamed protein product [Somion occarium]|uniref:Uncharacterized protein n=1 Tax=Somion occarium TaxID=3059160 RepID=A0ABP1EAW1_9APHY
MSPHTSDRHNQRYQDRCIYNARHLSVCGHLFLYLIYGEGFAAFLYFSFFFPFAGVFHSSMHFCALFLATLFVMSTAAPLQGTIVYPQDENIMPQGDILIANWLAIRPDGDLVLREGAKLNAACAHSVCLQIEDRS